MGVKVAKNKNLGKSIVIIILAGLFYFYTSSSRAKAGYFTSSNWIFIDGVAWVIFFGTMTAFAITFVVDFAKKN